MPDAEYKNSPYVFDNAGWTAKYVGDRLPPNKWIDLTNMESRFEKSVSSRLGNSAITVSGTTNAPLADTNIHTLGRMKSLGGNNYRYAGAGQNIYRRAGDGTGAYTKINGSNTLSGNRFQMMVFRPDFSSFPYIFFADSSQMMKDTGILGQTQTWGIFPPTVPPSLALVNPSQTSVETFDATGPLTFSNYTGTSAPNRVNTTLSSPISSTGLQTATPASMAGILQGVILNINSAEKVMVIDITDTTFTAVFASAHSAGESVVDINVSGSVAAGTLASISKAGAINLDLVGSLTAEDDDLINFWVNISNPANVDEIRILFDVGDGSFNSDYYMKAITPDTLQPVIDQTQTASTGLVNQVYTRASGLIDTRGFGLLDPIDGGELLPQDDSDLVSLRPATLVTGVSVWTRIQVRRSEFIAVGLAGIPGKDWANVKAWKVTIKTNSNGSITAALDDIYLFGGSGLDVLGGVSYDYRITFYNGATGAESNPSQTLITDSWVNPSRQGVLVSWTASTDAQVTHVRVYRRGGTLATGWQLVKSVPIASGTSYTDTTSDAGIAANKSLEIDNDPPVTSTLQVPVDTTLGTVVAAGSSQAVTPGSMTNIVKNQYVTIGQGDTQETVIVTSITGSTFTAYFQYAHASTEAVYAVATPGKGMNIGTIAFGRAWLAGDPNNPHFLYYSKINRPESFSPAQYVEVGTPNDPIVAVIEFKGQLWVATTTTWYQILGIGVTPFLTLGSGTPNPLKTGSRHGMVGSFAWCLAENAILYRSGDGIYAFAGGQSTLVSLDIQWIPDGLNNGPVPAMDQAQISSNIFAFQNNEIFISYADTNGDRRRAIFSMTYNRWRPDDEPATAMFYEEDKYQLVIGKANGMIYIDRVNDYDDGGYSSGVAVKTPIAISTETPYADQDFPQVKKNYNNVTVDIDTNGQDVTIILLFNDGVDAPLTLGTVNCQGRQKVNLKIENGDGYLAYNVALRATASVTKVVTIYQMDIDGVVDTQTRLSFDSWWCKYGSDDFKTVKEGRFEYIADDAGGVTFQCFIEGSSTAKFSFNLPQSHVRNAVTVRFPPVKAKLWRWIATSAADFRLYDDSQVEVKPAGSQRGYSPQKLMT